MNPEILKIITYILAGLSVAMAITAVILFFKLKIVKAIKELRGIVAVQPKKSSTRQAQGAVNANVALDDDEDEEEGYDNTIALVADENTYINFKIIKNLIYVNTAEVIS